MVKISQIDKSMRDTGHTYFDDEFGYKLVPQGPEARVKIGVPS